MRPMLGVRSPLRRGRRFRVDGRLLKHGMRNHVHLIRVEVTPRGEIIA
jgi:hypothetical protein